MFLVESKLVKFGSLLMPIWEIEFEYGATSGDRTLIYIQPEIIRTPTQIDDKSRTVAETYPLLAKAIRKHSKYFTSVPNQIYPVQNRIYPVPSQFILSRIESNIFRLGFIPVPKRIQRVPNPQINPVPNRFILSQIGFTLSRVRFTLVPNNI